MAHALAVIMGTGAQSKHNIAMSSTCSVGADRCTVGRCHAGGGQSPCACPDPNSAGTHTTNGLCHAICVPMLRERIQQRGEDLALA